jgi:hypothetical protein
VDLNEIEEEGMDWINLALERHEWWALVNIIMNYSYNKSQRDALFLKFIFDKELYMFQTDRLSIISSLNTVYTTIGICHASDVDCLLARLGWNYMTNTYCCVYSVETPDDRQ